MKQIFDWLREQMEEISYEEEDYFSNSFLVIDSEDAIEKVNEAEAKFGGHAICYLDSPCEYQNEDIRVDEEAECCEWKRKILCGGEVYHNCNSTYDDTYNDKFEFCPYCRKRINISEVE